MAKVNASVELLGLDSLQRLFRRVDSELQDELVEAVFLSTRPLLRDMHSKAHTRIQRRAVSTVEVRKHSKGIELTGGQGHGLGADLFPGAEFGGLSSKKKLVRARVFGQPTAWVKKRTTMMFKYMPHLGKHGYFYWPSVREWLPQVHKDVEARAAEVLRGR